MATPVCRSCTYVSPAAGGTDWAIALRCRPGQRSDHPAPGNKTRGCCNAMRRSTTVVQARATESEVVTSPTIPMHAKCEHERMQCAAAARATDRIAIIVLCPVCFTSSLSLRYWCMCMRLLPSHSNTVDVVPALCLPAWRQAMGRGSIKSSLCEKGWRLWGDWKF